MNRADPMPDIAKPEAARPGATGMVVLLSGSALLTLLFGALGPILPTIAQQFGANGAMLAQLLMSMPAIGIIAGGLIAGWVAERLGVRRLLTMALLLYAVLGSAGLYLGHGWLLLASRLLLGVSVAAVCTAIDTLVGAFFADDRRARILGLQGACGGATSVAALLASGWLGEAAGWRAPFAIYLIAVPLFLLSLRLPAPPAAPVEERKASSRAVLAELWPVYLLLIPAYVALFMNAIQISFLLSANGIDQPTMRGAIIAGASVTSGLAGACYGFVHARAPSRMLFAAICLLMGVSYFLIGLGTTLWVVVAGVALGGVAGGFLTPHVAAYLLARARPEMRGRAIGLMFTVLFLGDFLNPLLVAPVRAAIGIHGAFVLVAGMLVVAGLIAVLGGRRGVRAT